MAGYRQREKKRRTKFWAAVVLLTAATLALGILLTGPSPPKRIRLATGQPGGGYAGFGEEYQRRLGRLGLHVELVPTNGSIDNLQRLLRGEVEVAFVQGGAYPMVEDPEGRLRGLCAVCVEPLWVFTRREHDVSTLARLRGKTISIGPTESGTEVVARLLLQAHGIDGQNARLVHLLTPDAGARLRDGRLDAVFIISSYRDPVVQELLHRDDVELHNFRREVAYARKFPYLTPVHLPEGLFDLQHNIPAEEKVVLAPAALLVCREDLHPRVVEQLLKTAHAVHSAGSLIDAPNRFPALEGVDVPVHDTADTYMKSGESFLSRVLPYWALRLLLLGQILVLPVLAVWLPFFKVVPMIYTYRVNRLLRRHYVALREVEGALERAEQPEVLRERLQDLEQLRGRMEWLSRKVPAHLQRDVYHWRLHVSLVRQEALDRLRRLEEKLEGGRSGADAAP